MKNAFKVTSLFASASALGFAGTSNYNTFTASMLKEAHNKKVKFADLQMR